jgi:hypothetical protein
MARARAVVALSLAAVLLGGCDLLMGGAFGPGFDGAFPSSSPIATYRTGSARIAIAGSETIKLDKLAAGAAVDSLFGSAVRWTGSSGWSMQLSGAGTSGGGFMPTPGGFLTFDRIADGQHRTTFDGTRCLVEIDVIDESAVRGTATCKGLEWYDALVLQPGPAGPVPLDEPKFDAEVTFEAVR